MPSTIMQEKAAMAKALAGAVREALVRADTDHIAFHGCIDWHSAVHGTWALTAYTRMTGDTQHAPFISDILTPEKVAAERAFIASLPDFEMPYGRAWFLRLAHGTPIERANWRLIAGGEGIHWPGLDEDISVASLLAGRGSGETQASLRRWLQRREFAR